MSLQYLRAIDFRCLRTIEFEPDAQYALVYGSNASGKTSILEAIGYLGRGKSFRGANTLDLIRHGSGEFVLFGRGENRGRPVSLGVRNSRSGLEVHVDGRAGQGAATLAAELPLQVVDPEVHKLVAGGPDERRRYLDWIAFHVEHGYLESWRRFRRALRQRNAALRSGASDGVIFGWNQEFLRSATIVHEARLSVVGLARGAFAAAGERLLETGAQLNYRSGWSSEMSLEEALLGGLKRDREQGGTGVGPHRGDLGLILDERQARKLVSRGQQKLLACAMILTAVELVQNKLEQPLLLLLDDPAAELDAVSLERLMLCVTGLGCQVIATALTPDAPLFPASPALFHVEQGELRKQG